MRVLGAAASTRRFCSRTAEDRQWAADRREFVADDRQEQADARELLADERESIATRRDEYLKTLNMRLPTEGEFAAEAKAREEKAAAQAAKDAARAGRRAR